MSSRIDLNNDPDLTAVIDYMRSHWSSPVKPEWQVELAEYPALLQRAVVDLSQNATRNHRFFRIAGISGSGKTTQILPAVQAYCKQNHLRPVLLAARQFLQYHPHYQEIVDFYGEQNLRKMTDEFVTIMLFLSLAQLIAVGFDIILDVTLLDPKMEAILLKFLRTAQSDFVLLMVAVSPVVTEKFLAGRAWRHAHATETEFVRATELALKFYAAQAPAMRTIIWSVYQKLPEYDGAAKNCLDTFARLSAKTTLPRQDDDARRQAKIDYLAQTDLSSKF